MRQAAHCEGSDQKAEASRFLSEWAVHSFRDPDDRGTTGIDNGLTEEGTWIRDHLAGRPAEEQAEAIRPYVETLKSCER